MAGRPLDRMPAATDALRPLAVAARASAGLEWRGSPLAPLAAWPARARGPRAPTRTTCARPTAEARPAHPGRRRSCFGGETLAPGARGDPWDRPSPSRRFAEALHGFGWLRDLLRRRARPAPRRPCG